MSDSQTQPWLNNDGITLSLIYIVLQVYRGPVCPKNMIVIITHPNTIPNQNDGLSVFDGQQKIFITIVIVIIWIKNIQKVKKY